MSRQTQKYTILDAASSMGSGKSILVDDFKHIELSLNTSGSAQGTIKVAGSMAEDAPDFDSAQSPDNPFDYVEIVDLKDGSLIDGDTGITLSGTDDNRLLQVNTDGLRWVTVKITSYTAGDWTVKGRLYSNG